MSVAFVTRFRFRFREDPRSSISKDASSRAEEGAEERVESESASLSMGALDVRVLLPETTLAGRKAFAIRAVSWAIREVRILVLTTWPWRRELATEDRAR
jgi:hypothetical protein